MEDDFISEFFINNKINLDFSEVKSIIGCPKCLGAGYTEREELTSYHKGEYTTFYDTCKKCDGEGKVTKTIVTGTINLKYPRDRLTLKKESMKPFSQDPIKEPFIHKNGKTQTFKQV